MKALGSNGCRNFYKQTTVSFWVFSWLGNCKHNLWQASRLLCSRHRNRPCLPGSTRKRQMVGELALTTQWCRGHGMKACLADLIQPTEEVTGKPTRHKRLSTIRGCFLHTALLCSHFFNGRQWYFFSPLCDSPTQFQLFDQLAKRTSHRNSFDIDPKLDLLLKNKTKKAQKTNLFRRCFQFPIN